MSYITKVNLHDTQKRENGDRLLQLITAKLIDCGIVATESVEAMFAAYVMYKAALNPQVIPNYQSIIQGDLIPLDLLPAFKDKFKEEAWNRLYPEFANISAEELALAVFSNANSGMNRRPIDITSESIIKLASRILAICENDKVADFCSGYGDFVNESILEQPNVEYTEYEIDINKALVAKLRMDILGENVKIFSQDIFSIEKDKKYDKIFSHYPFGLRHRMLGCGNDYMEELKTKCPAVFKATSSDWIFNSLMCDHLENHGKAIGIMTNGSTCNSLDRSVRKFFVEQGLIEAVIALPERMFMSYNIPVTMVILSHGNKKVRMIDATQSCHQGRRYNEFKDTDIDDIMEALRTDSEISSAIELNQLRENDYTLSLHRYIANIRTFENGMRLEDVAKEIIRGANCSASTLDEITTEKITNMQFLKLANIQDGVIDDNLPYLSEINSRYDRNCLKNYDLVLSRNGYPFKLAVVELNEGQKILANGNLFIIRLDLDKMNPYYLKAFFESETGIELLKSIAGTATIPNINASTLRSIVVPVPPMEEQEKIAQKYKGTILEIDMLKIKLEKAKNRLREIWDEEGVQ